MNKELNLPKTDFSQRSNSTQREPELLKFWEQNNVFNTRNELNTKDTFTLHSGPPYSNGDVHMGHVLNMTLKDMMCKYHLMNGHKVNFRPGFDCHGLPTEMAVEKKYGKLPTTELRQKCQELAYDFSLKQKSSFKSLSVFADWDNPYYTMSKEYEVKELDVLYSFLEKGLVYLDNRPVYYSPSSHTVLAESELEYMDRKDMACYATFELKDDNRKLLVWTTQPWTLLGNVAVCVNDRLTYVDYQFEDQVYVVLKSKTDLFNFGSLLREYTGDKLCGLKYFNKLTNLTGVVVSDKFVKSDSGTGLVHLCPAHGEEDFEVCKKYNLQVLPDLTDTHGKLANGMFCLDGGSKWVLESLFNLGMLFKQEEYVHSYPHDWRTKKPVYFKLTEQFFLDLTQLKKKCQDQLDSVEFSDVKWKNRLTNMLNMREKWCLSRQRKWGFPLAVFLKDGNPFFNDSLKVHLKSLFEKYGSDCWFNLSDNELLPVEYHHLGLVKCEYTLDVWFDSGVSWYSVVGGQSDVYLEGSDQCRGWFQSSLLCSVAMNNTSPYKKLVCHGFVLDENGFKMAKLMGNVVEPKQVQTKYNTDVLRLWVSVVNYSDDFSMGDGVLKSCGEYYFKFRNTLKYLLGNMYGFYDNNVSLCDKEVKALTRLDEMYSNCLFHYQNYDFRKVFENLMSWVSDFSSQYLDVETKSYLYEYDLDSLDRQRCQFVMKEALEKFMKVLAPLCSFLAEDAYQNYEFKQKESVFMEEF